MASVLPLMPFIVKGAPSSWKTGWEGSDDVCNMGANLLSTAA
jgi:hypothetical protein